MSSLNLCGNARKPYTEENSSISTDMQIQNIDSPCSLASAMVDISSQGKPRTISGEWKEQGWDSPAVKVDISAESLSAYKETFQRDKRPASQKPEPAPHTR